MVDSASGGAEGSAVPRLDVAAAAEPLSTKRSSMSEDKVEVVIEVDFGAPDFPGVLEKRLSR